jgi:hypothetical protein
MVKGAAPALAARRTVLRRALAAGCAVLACVLVAAQAPVGVRAPVVVVFLCVVPGMALVGLVNPDSFAVELSLSIALSVALSGLTAGVLVYTHRWSPTAVVVIVAAISLAGGLRDVWLGHRVRHARSPSGGDAAPAPAGRAEKLAERSRRERAVARPVTALPLSLQRFVTQRAIREINPELWFVDNLERRLPRQTRASRGEPAGRTPPRGVSITGVSAHTSIPIAWRIEDDEKAKEWRTRFALEMIDALPELGAAVVAAGAAFGSLAGFRRGLEARCLAYLLQVDPVTAAREVAPDRKSRSATEARQILQERTADGAAVLSGAQPKGSHEEPDLVIVEGAGHLLMCEVRATMRAGVFWLSNLPAETAPGRLAYLIRLANRSSAERAAADLLGALEAQGGSGVGLDRELALVALAGRLRTLDLFTLPAERVVET